MTVDTWILCHGEGDFILSRGGLSLHVKDEVGIGVSPPCTIENFEEGVTIHVADGDIDGGIELDPNDAIELGERLIEAATENR